jgi:hypothetical protein
VGRTGAAQGGHRLADGCAAELCGESLADRALAARVCPGDPGPVPVLPGRPPAILSALLAFVAVGFYEELFSRGYQLRNLAEGLNGRLLGARGGLLLAWLLSSLVFGLLHGANPGATPVSTANIVVAGLMLGLGYLLTGELAIPIGLHIAWNFFEGNVFGFPTSGAEAGATFIAIVQGGPELWTGGAFGPEAGLLGLGGMLACCLLIVGWVRGRRGIAALYRTLADPPQLAAAQSVGSAGGN